MATFKQRQRSLSGGEIAPWLIPRGDTEQYVYSCLLCRNAMPGGTGAAFNRPGTEFVRASADHDFNSRLTAWQFDEDDRYALEWGDGTLRFYQQGAALAAVQEDGSALAAWSSTTSYVTGAMVASGGINYYARIPTTGDGPPSPAYRVEFTGLLALANQNAMTVNSASLTGGGSYSVSTLIGGSATTNEVQAITHSGVVTGGTFTITWNAQTTSAIAFNASAATVQAALEALSNIAVGDVDVTAEYVWHAMPTTGELELPTPYLDADDVDVYRTRFVQLFDLTWLANRVAAPHVLKRVGHVTWTLGAERFLPSIAAPLGVTLSGTGLTGSAQEHRYKVIAIKGGDNPIQSLPADGAHYASGPLSGGGGSNITVTAGASHGVVNGQNVYVALVYPTTGDRDEDFEEQLAGLGNGSTGTTATNVTATAFDLVGTSGLTVPAGYAAIILPLGTVVDTDPFTDVATVTGNPESDAKLTAAAHGLATGDEIVILVGTNTGGNRTTPEARSQIVGRIFSVTVHSSSVFSLDSSKGIDWDNDVGLIVFARAEAKGDGVANLSSTNPIDLTWFPVAGADLYWVFKLDAGGTFHFLGQTETESYTDDGSATIGDGTVPKSLNPFYGPGNWPQAVGLCDQRLIWAGTDNDPSKWWASRAGDFKNLTNHNPVLPDDAFAETLAASNVRDVRHIVDADQLVLLTGGRKIVPQGDADGSLTPTSTNSRPRGGDGGASHVRPLVIDQNILFIDDRQGFIRQFRLDLVQGQVPANVSKYAPHLFLGYTIVDWCYTATPVPMIYLVRSDGKLITCTYDPLERIVAFARHDTGDGTDFGFESVCAITEDGIDRVYTRTRRTIGGSTKRYVERFALRKAGDADYDLIDDARHLDCAINYDGRNTSAVTLTLTTAPWGAGSSHTLTASSATFAGTGADVGKKFKLYGADGSSVIVTVTLQSSTTVCTATAATAVPASLQATATATWSLLCTSLSGLSHLEGRTVGVLGDGVVLDDEVVASGAIVPSVPSEVVRAGLPYPQQIRTLPPSVGNQPNAGVIEDAEKKAAHITLDVTQTIAHRDQGLRAGVYGGETRLLERPKGNPDAVDADFGPTTLLNGKLRASPDGQPFADATVLLESNDPLPWMVNGFIIEWETEAPLV